MSPSQISTEPRESHEPATGTASKNVYSLEYAQQLDAQDSLKHLRDEFVRPTREMIRKVKPAGADKPAETSKNGDHTHTDRDLALYFCGNSLGLQPKAVEKYVLAQLQTWASIGVKGHFQAFDAGGDSSHPIPPWQEMGATCSKQMARLVGAAPEEVVTMNSLTANLHLMMASFYRPTEKRHKIIAEWKPFPSDSYALESQIVWHGLDVSKSLVELQPDENLYISTESVLATIDAHAEETALLMLPGIQYYTGQLFDIPRITAHAQSKGIVVGWDLAHAVGNVELQLHDWNVDFAVWCTYKYLNAGPGSIAGAFVHERHGKVERTETAGSSYTSENLDTRTGGFKYQPRLSGWYGNDINVRFNMAKTFQPTPGAQGFQLSNPSGIDLASLSGALSVFDKTDMATLRKKSQSLTGYAEKLLNNLLAEAATNSSSDKPPFRIITPANPAERGAQLSILLRDSDLLEKWTVAMDRADLVMDKRKPNVIRLAPVPLYNTYTEVHQVVSLLREVIFDKQ